MGRRGPKASGEEEIAMPYKSEKQRAWMHIHEPEIAEKWDAEIKRRKRRQSKKSKKRWNKRKRKDKAARDTEQGGDDWRI